MESRKVNDLQDKELIKELTNLEDKLKAEYSILANYKAYKNELLEEMQRRFTKYVISEKGEN